ncbi:hypothetical protein K470DRAFT_199788, partial [Piedraia hortae CBS 480.64]
PPPQVANLHSSSTIDSAPCSPTQTYLNLLILESSLRAQYIALRARLRLHLFLLVALWAWVAGFTYLLFFRPREDGSGAGGSIYWMLESFEKLSWCGGVVTLGLFYGTGMYDRGVRWPRKLVPTANRGLRVLNLKVVIVKEPWWHIFRYFRNERICYRLTPRDILDASSGTGWNGHAARHGLVDEDVAPAGDLVKVLLLPKPFTPNFREGWETYRLEYWEKENARRAELRQALQQRQREVARKRKRGWF